MALGYASPFFVEGEADFFARYVYHKHMLPATPNDFDATMTNYLAEATTNFAGPAGKRMEDATGATIGIFAAGAWFVAFLFGKAGNDMGKYMAYHVNRAPLAATSGTELTSSMNSAFETTFGLTVAAALDEFHDTFLPMGTADKMAILWTSSGGVS